MKYNYKIVKNSKGRKRTYSIVVGLRQGYDDTLPLFDRDVVIKAAEEWMIKREFLNQPYLTGIVSAVGEVLYPHYGKSGKEPVVIFSGEIPNLYFPKEMDGIIVDMVNELASILGNSTKQQRVYVSYCDENWILETEL